MKNKLQACSLITLNSILSCQIKLHWYDWECSFSIWREELKNVWFLGNLKMIVSRVNHFSWVPIFPWESLVWDYKLWAGFLDRRSDPSSKWIDKHFQIVDWHWKKRHLTTFQLPTETISSTIIDGVVT